MSHAPICCWCAYNLTGLTFPRACPECGQRIEEDPAIQEDRARAWFRSRRAWCWWLLPTARLPVGLWYVLHDAESIRTARRRVTRLIWLPAVATTLIVILGSGLELDFQVRSWFYRISDPQRRSIREESSVETDRLFTLNLHLRGLFSNQPANTVRVDERTPTGLRYSFPEVDVFAGLWAGMPWLILVLAYWPGLLLVRLVMARRAVRRHGRPSLRVSAASACSLVSLPLGVALWGWLLIAVLEMLSYLTLSPEVPLEWLVWIMAAIVWISAALCGVVVWPRLLALDRGRVFFAERGWWTLLFVVWSLGLPAWLMVRIL